MNAMTNGIYSDTSSRTEGNRFKSYQKIAHKSVGSVDGQIESELVVKMVMNAMANDI